MIRVFGCDCRDCEKYQQNKPCNDEHRFCDHSLAEHDASVKSKAIDELLKLSKAQSIYGYSIAMADLEGICEQIKKGE